MKYFVIIFVVISIYHVCAIPRPPYIHACKRDDPNLNECAEKMGIIAVPELVKGDPVYNIPKMNPMFIDHIDLAVPNLNLKTRNVTVRGLETAVPLKFHFNLTSRDLIYDIYVPLLDISGNYILKGRLLVFPLEGDGFLRVKYVNGTYTYRMHYELIERKGIKYINTTEHSLDLKCDRAFYNFTNLFNGNQALADNILKFMDENWKEVNKDFGPLLAKAIDQIAYYTSNAILTRVPYDDIFLP